MKKTLLPFSLLGAALALGLAAHASVVHHPFVWDDGYVILANASIEDLSRPVAILRHSLSRPLVNVSYALDHWFWGGRDPGGFHLTNLLLHLFNVGLLFWLARGIARDLAARRRLPSVVASRAADVTGFAAASLFAVHPLMTEAVGFVSARPDLICGAFALGSLICLRRAVGRGSRAAMAAALACLAGALLSKETGGMLPFAWLALDRWLIGADDLAAARARLRRLHLPLIGLVLIGGATRIWLFLVVEYPDAGSPPGHAALSAAHVIVRYVGLLFVPVGQTIVPVVSPILSIVDRRVAEAVLGLTAIGLAVLWCRRRAPLAAFGLAFFLLMLVPSSALTVLSEFGQAMSEHRTYVPVAGFFMAVSTLVFAMEARTDARPPAVRAAAVVIFIAAVTVFMSLTMARHRAWRDPVALWADAETKAPQAWLAVHGLADAHREQGDCRAAMDLYRRAAVLSPGNGASYLGWATCLLQSGQLSGAMQTLRLGASRAPGDALLKLELARLEERFGDRLEARRLCGEVLSRIPSHAVAAACLDRLK